MKRSERSISPSTALTFVTPKSSLTVRWSPSRICAKTMANGAILRLAFSQESLYRLRTQSAAIEFESFPFARHSNMKRVSSSLKLASDLKRLTAKKDPAIVVDDDAPTWTPEMFARAVIKRGLDAPPTKTLLSLRVDSDVVGWFRAQGRGYQSRMNALLRAYMDAHRQSRRRAG